MSSHRKMDHLVNKSFRNLSIKSYILDIHQNVVKVNMKEKTTFLILSRVQMRINSIEVSLNSY